MPTCTFSAISLSSQPVSILFNWKLSVSSSLIRYSTVVRKSPRIDSSFKATTMFLGEGQKQISFSNKCPTVFQLFSRTISSLWGLRREGKETVPRTNEGTRYTCAHSRQNFQEVSKLVSLTNPTSWASQITDTSLYRTENKSRANHSSFSLFPSFHSLTAG